MDRPQYKFLKRIKKSGVYNYQNCQSEEKETISFFAKRGYIVYISDDNNLARNPAYLCKISQEGRAALYEWASVRYYRFMPIVIATLSLMKSYGIGIDDIVIYGMRLLKQQ